MGYCRLNLLVRSGLLCSYSELFCGIGFARCVIACFVYCGIGLGVADLFYGIVLGETKFFWSLRICFAELVLCASELFCTLQNIWYAVELFWAPRQLFWARRNCFEELVLRAAELFWALRGFVLRNWFYALRNCFCALRNCFGRDRIVLWNWFCALRN